MAFRLANCFFAPLFVAVVAFAPAIASAQGYVPYSPNPSIAGTASAPTTLTVKRAAAPDDDPPAADTFPYTITGKDTDTWVAIIGGAYKEFVDNLSLAVISEEYTPTGGPIFRGIDPTSNISTWDFVVKGLSLPFYLISPEIPQRICVNKYRLYNDTSVSPRYVAQNDTALIVSQTIIVPAHR